MSLNHDITSTLRTDLAKKRRLLSILTCRPDCDPNYMRKSLSLFKLLSFALTEVKNSSAKSKWATTEAEWRLYDSQALATNPSFRVTERPSITKLNRYGERGSSYWRPLFDEKDPFGAPLINTEKEGVLMHSLVHAIQQDVNLMHFRMWRMYLLSTMSNAL